MARIFLGGDFARTGGGTDGGPTLPDLVDLGGSSIRTESRIMFVTCRLFSEVVLVRRRGTGEGAGLLLGLGSVLERTNRGRIEATEEVGWEFL
jgi:hypothetical protein